MALATFSARAVRDEANRIMTVLAGRIRLIRGLSGETRSLDALNEGLSGAIVCGLQRLDD